MLSAGCCSLGVSAVVGWQPWIETKRLLSRQLNRSIHCGRRPSFGVAVAAFGGKASRADAAGSSAAARCTGGPVSSSSAGERVQLWGLPRSTIFAGSSRSGGGSRRSWSSSGAPGRFFVGRVARLVAVTLRNWGAKVLSVRRPGRGFRRSMGLDCRGS